MFELLVLIGVASLVLGMINNPAKTLKNIIGLLSFLLIGSIVLYILGIFILAGAS